MSTTITGTIENWYVEQVTKREFIIWGNIMGDINKRWEDGQLFHTSGIKNRKVREGELVQTRNSLYKLGERLEH